MNKIFLLLTNGNIFFWLMFFSVMCYSIAQASSYEDMHFLGNKTVLLVKSVKQNNDEYKKILLNVQRYFKCSKIVKHNKAWPLQKLNILVTLPEFQKFYKPSCLILNNFPGLTWLKEKIEKSIKNNEDDTKKLLMRYDLSNAVFKNTVTYALSKDLLAFVIDYNNAFYLKKNINLSDRQLEQIRKYNQQINSFLHYKERQEYIDINDLEKIVHCNVLDLKFGYIENSFLELLPAESENFNQTLQDYINDLDNCREKLVTIWKDYVIKKLITEQNQDHIAKECKRIDDCHIDQKLKQIIRFNYEYIEKNCFIYMFKDIVTLPSFDENFFIELKKRLLEKNDFGMDVKGNPGLKKLNTEAELNTEVLMKNILNQEQLQIKNEPLLETINLQLINARTLIFLHSLKKYTWFCLDDNGYNDYWNKVHLIYDKELINTKNIRIADQARKPQYCKKTIFDFIQSIELEYIPYLLRSENSKNYLYNYSKYIDFLIWPLLKEKYFVYEKNAVENFESMTMVRKLCKLIEWEKDGFKQVLYSYYVNDYKEEIKKKLSEVDDIHGTFINVVLKSNEYSTIIKKIKDFFDNPKVCSFKYSILCKIYNCTSEERFLIDHYIKILQFVSKEIPHALTAYYENIKINQNKQISLDQQFYSLYSDHIVPYFSKYEAEKCGNIKFDVKKIFKDIKKIKQYIELEFLQEQFKDSCLFEYIKSLVKYGDWPHISLVDLEKKSITPIIMFIKDQLIKVCNNNNVNAKELLRNINMDSVHNDLLLVKEDRNWQTAATIFTQCITYFFANCIKNKNDSIINNILVSIVENKFFTHSDLLVIFLNIKKNREISIDQFIMKFLYFLARELEANPTNYLNHYLNNKEKYADSKTYFTDEASFCAFLKSVSNCSLYDQDTYDKYTLMCKLYTFEKCPTVKYKCKKNAFINTTFQ